MSTENPTRSQKIVDEVILDAVQRGFHDVSDIISYSGPIISEVKDDSIDRELDTPQVMWAIDRLVDDEYLERTGERFAAQLRVRITDKGREIAPRLTSTEESLISEANVAPEGLVLLSHIIRFETAEGELPSISQLRRNSSLDLDVHQIHPLFVQLSNARLAQKKGIFRFRIAPTEKGRQLVEEYKDFITDTAMGENRTQ